jgi:hypothetical protein
LYKEGAVGGALYWDLARYAPSTNTVETPIHLLPGSGAQTAAWTGASLQGKLSVTTGAYALVEGADWDNQVWNNVLQVSDDLGSTFTPPQPLDFMLPQDAPPQAVPLDDGRVILLWQDTEPTEMSLMTSTASRKRPCE